MSNETAEARGIFADITRHLAGIFRHMLPGVLLVGGFAIAYPDRLRAVDLNSWPHLAVLAVISLAAGNTWYALNRYGFHQLVDYILWRLGYDGPAKTKRSQSYIDDLGRYPHRSLSNAST